MAKPVLVALSAPVLLPGGCTAGPSAPVEADTPAPGPIVLSRSPDARHIQPRGVSADSGDEAWGIGYYKKDGYNSRHHTLILHWDGTSWSPVASPNPYAPRANAFAERWVGSVRRECLDHILVLGQRHLQRVLSAYVEHYNRARPHRGLDLQPPDPGPRAQAVPGTKVRRHDILGGLIHEYHRSAA